MDEHEISKHFHVFMVGYFLKILLLFSNDSIWKRVE